MAISLGNTTEASIFFSRQGALGSEVIASLYAPKVVMAGENIVSHLSAASITKSISTPFVSLSGGGGSTRPSSGQMWPRFS